MWKPAGCWFSKVGYKEGFRWFCRDGEVGRTAGSCQEIFGRSGETVRLNGMLR